MASLQVDSSPLEDVITETEATSKEPQTVEPAPENIKTVDVEDEDDLDDLTAPTYEEKVENSDDEDAEYSSFEAAAPFKYGGAGGPATFDDFNEDEDEDA